MEPIKRRPEDYVFKKDYNFPFEPALASVTQCTFNEKLEGSLL